MERRHAVRNLAPRRPNAMHGSCEASNLQLLSAHLGPLPVVRIKEDEGF